MFICWSKFVIELIFPIGTKSYAKLTYNSSKNGREKSIHHDLLLWDKEISPSDPSTFAGRFIRVLGWDFIFSPTYRSRQAVP